MTEIAFKEIWDTLSAVDVSEYTEEKMKLTYLSWSRAWMLTVDRYANAQYTFHDFDGAPYRTLPDGTGEVVTSVNIEGHIRSMPLPIMDYKMNAVVNPNARQVNDNRMRCLVKNLAMFGLGISVFTAFDDHLPGEEKDAQPAAKKPPRKKPAREKEEFAPENGHNWGEHFIEAMTVGLQMQETRKNLTDFWKEHKEEIGKLKSEFPVLKNKLDEMFKERSENIEKDTEQPNNQK
tara:strand:- start:3296 stop:3997 length:702 start_codon:yes stop_codon:yes gene_type:complete